MYIHPTGSIEAQYPMIGHIRAKSTQNRGIRRCLQLKERTNKTALDQELTTVFLIQSISKQLLESM
jgi:hypothetical protein